MNRILRKILVPSLAVVGILAALPSVALADERGAPTHFAQGRGEHERAERGRFERERFERERFERERHERERIERERIARERFERERQHQEHFRWGK